MVDGSVVPGFARRCGAAALGLGIGLASPGVRADGAAEALRDQRLAVESVAALFADALAEEGGYVWAYSPDGSVRRAEGGTVAAGAISNQPPGTPAVGAAFLKLYEVTGERRWRDEAEASVGAILAGQLLSGGWYNFTETEPEARRLWCYRSEGLDGEGCKGIDGNESKNRTSLDDNITQSAIGLLLWWDEISGGSDSAREAAEYALARLLRAQHPNGSWPVFFTRTPDYDGFVAAWRSEAAPDWPREWTKPEVGPVMVINDNLVRDTIRVLLAAERRFGREDLLAAAMRSGEFLLAAQLPAPQRGWAQTYDGDLRPVWGRRFEPPAAASFETAGSIEALLDLYARTGKRRYLEGAIEAAAWLQSVRLEDGGWARFYELGTNRPLYVREDGSLTYEREGLREGYGQYGGFGIPEILARVDRVVAGEPSPPSSPWDWIFEPAGASDRLATLRFVAAAADPQGRVIEDGWIRSETFVDAARALAETVDSP